MPGTPDTTRLMFHQFGPMTDNYATKPAFQAYRELIGTYSAGSWSGSSGSWSGSSGSWSGSVGGGIKVFHGDPLEVLKPLSGVGVPARVGSRRPREPVPGLFGPARIQQGVGVRVEQGP